MAGVLSSRDDFAQDARNQHESLPPAIDRIHNPDDRRIGGNLIRKKRKAGFFAPAPVDQLTGAGARAVCADDASTGWFPIHSERLNDQQALPLQVLILYCGPEATDHLSQKHNYPSSRTSSTIPMMAVSTGVSLQPSAIRAELPDTAITRSR